MIRHVLRLIWNRKRANFMLAVEILVSFLVLFAVATLGIFYADSYRRPLGYEWENVWSVDVEQNATEQPSQRPAVPTDAGDPDAAETLRQVLLSARSFPGVVGVAGVFPGPWSDSNQTRDDEREGRRIEYRTATADDGLADVLRLHLTRGRWFSAEDDGATWTPVVVNERLAHEVFEGEDPLGQRLNGEREPDGQPAREELRVVGVVDDYRPDGEYGASVSFAFTRGHSENPASNAARTLLVRVAPGTGAQTQEKLGARIQAVARDWSFRVTPLADVRSSANRLRLTPVVAVGLLAASLMLMVALGLSGVLWQSVTRRRSEIGLRRAQGATAGQIQAQVLLEIGMLTALALAAGVVLLAQLPLLGVADWLGARVYLTGLGLSAAAILGLAVLSGLYPSWIATRISPADALRYE